MHSWYGTEWNFPSIERGTNVLGPESSAASVSSSTQIPRAYQFHPLPGRTRRDPEPWPFDGQAWWKESAATAWEIGSGKPARCLAPNHRCVHGCSADGAAVIPKHPSLSCSGVSLWSSFPSVHFQGKEQKCSMPMPCGRDSLGPRPVVPKRNGSEPVDLT